MSSGTDGSGAAVRGELAREIDGPINIIAGSGGLDINGLVTAGVKRISLASGIARAAYGAVRDALTEISDAGSLGFLQNAMPHPDLNKAFEK